MEEVFIECSPGISGDMLLGAFYDLGVPKKVIEQPLVDLGLKDQYKLDFKDCLLYTSPSPRDGLLSRMPSSA